MYRASPCNRARESFRASSSSAMRSRLGIPSYARISEEFSPANFGAPLGKMGLIDDMKMQFDARVSGNHFLQPVGGQTLTLLVGVHAIEQQFVHRVIRLAVVCFVDAVNID